MKVKQVLTATASLVLSACLFTLPASAISGQQTARLDYNNIKITLNGDVVLPSDANGNYVEPFAISGTTYLPVRAIGNAMGLSVGWNASNNTVVLTSGGDTTNASAAIPDSIEPRSITATLNYNDIRITLDGKNVIPMSSGSQPVEPFAIAGTTYLPVRGIASILGLNVDWDGTTNTVILETKDYSVNQVGAQGVPGVPDGWVRYSTSNLGLLLKAAANGNVIYRNGQYWCSPEYAASVGNEVVVSFEDVSGNNGVVDDTNFLKPDTVVTPSDNDDSSTAGWLEPKELDAVVSKIGIEKILNGQTASATVTDIEILQYCMPSIPDNFVENPVDGTYDGIRVKIENGKILLNESDLSARGLI